MNAETMEAGTPGSDVPPVDSEGMPEPWPVNTGEPDEPEQQQGSDPRDLADRGDANPVEPASAHRADARQLASWIDAMVDRDERALAALYDATFSRVFGIVNRIVRRVALTEEVVEDTYFQVWRQAVRFDATRGDALTWMLTIARSRALDALRREAYFQHAELDEDCANAFASDGRPSDELLDLARHQADLHQALMLLGAQPRQLVSLAFFRGLSHEEIASQTRLPLGTVKSQIRRALLTLRRILGDGAHTAMSS